MWQFKLHTTLFAVYLIVISQAADDGRSYDEVHNKFRLNGAESPSFSVSKTRVVTFDNEEFEAENFDGSTEVESNIAIVKQRGYQIISLAGRYEEFFGFDVETDVRFELYTSQNPKQPQMLTLGNYTTVKKSHFNWRHPTRILIHGW